MDSLAIVQRLTGGEFLDRFAAALIEISERVVVTGNKGSVTVVVKIEQFEEKEPTVVLEATIKTAPPAASPRATMFFAVDGELSREDPRKPELPGFRTVDMAPSDPIVLSDMEVSRG